jgi:hypothetical protein
VTDETPSLPPPPPPASTSAAWTDDAWSNAPAAPPPPLPIDAGQLRGLRSLSVAVIALIGVVALISIAAVPNDLAYIRSIQHVIDGQLPDISEIESQESTRSTFGAVVLVGLVAAGVT